MYAGVFFFLYEICLQNGSSVNQMFLKRNTIRTGYCVVFNRKKYSNLFQKTLLLDELNNIKNLFIIFGSVCNSFVSVISVRTETSYVGSVCLSPSARER